MTYKVGALTSELLGAANGIATLAADSRLTHTQHYPLKRVSIHAVPVGTDLTPGTKAVMVLPSDTNIYLTTTFAGRLFTAGDSTGTTLVDIHLDGTSVMAAPLTFTGTSIATARSAITNPFYITTNPVLLEVIVDSVHSVTPPKGLIIFFTYEDRGQ